MKIVKLKDGFSTVELLVALFVASAFLLSGYQLYTYIIKDIGETRAQARATNKTYDILQEWKTRTTSPCTESHQTFNQTVDRLSNVKVTVNITCPYYLATPPITNLSKVEIIFKYGSPQKQVVQATYVTK